MSFPLNWITNQICTGYAPKSYDDLDSIKDQGIDAIINLCGEYSDLHTIEEEAGFEVYWLPIEDDRAPDMEKMEKGLSWLDEAAYLGKKVFIHCNLGIGRTGTFLSAYFLRRGFTLRKTEKYLKKIPPSPTNFTQWSLLRKFGKKEGKLKLQEPTIDNRNRYNISQYIKAYEDILSRAEELADRSSASANEHRCCHKTDQRQHPLQVLETVFLSENMNISLSAEKRRNVIERAASDDAWMICPLKEGENCLLHSSRPLFCRLQKEDGNKEEIEALYQEIDRLSRELFIMLFGDLKEEIPPQVQFQRVLSGKFIQQYFDFLLSKR